MLLNLRTPPKPTGDNERDIRALTDWCNTTFRNVMLMFRNIDGDNITSVPSDRLTGMIDISLIPPSEETAATTTE